MSHLENHPQPDPSHPLPPVEEGGDDLEALDWLQNRRDLPPNRTNASRPRWTTSTILFVLTVLTVFMFIVLRFMRFG